MSRTFIHAVYEGGVFKPTEPVDLPEHCPVKVEPALDESEADRQDRAQEEIYEILSHRYDTGDTNAAERHNEHQP